MVPGPRAYRRMLTSNSAFLAPSTWSSRMATPNLCASTISGDCIGIKATFRPRNAPGCETLLRRLEAVKLVAGGRRDDHLVLPSHHRGLGPHRRPIHRVQVRILLQGK